VQAVYRVVAEAGKAAIELEHHGTVVLQDEYREVVSCALIYNIVKYFQGKTLISV
jgi:hypothetical protein